MGTVAIAPLRKCNTIVKGPNSAGDRPTAYLFRSRC